MRKMASPSALSRTLSLQRASARAKSSSRAESLADQQSQLSSKRILLFTSTPSSNNGLAGHNNVDAQSTALDEPSKQLNDLQQVDDDGNLQNAMKRCFSADVPYCGYGTCFSAWNERGVDLWDPDFSSMSSCASQNDGCPCGSRTRLNSDSSALCESAKGSKEDACSKSSWSQDSLIDAIRSEDGSEAFNSCRFEGRGIIGCTGGVESPPCFVCRNAQCGGAGSGLRVLEQHNILVPEYNDVTERAKIDYEAATTAGAGLEEYLLRRGGYLAQCPQVGASGTHKSRDDTSARDGDKQQALKAEGHSGKKSEEWGEGEMKTGSQEGVFNVDRLRVRCKGDYDKLEKEIMMSSESRYEENSDGMKSLRAVPAGSVAVEMVSVNVVEDFRESMYEMMLEKNMEECEDSSMQDLLNSYLLLNPSQLHNIIREVFSDVWIDIIMTLR